MRKRVSRWSTAQRVVVVVAWAAVLYCLWEWVQLGGWDQLFRSDDAWFNYTADPGTMSSETQREFRVNPGFRLLVQLGFVVAWLAPSFWLASARSAVAVDSQGPTPGPESAGGDA